MSYGKPAAWFGILLCVLWPVAAVAVGLGEIVVHSSLNQALDAEIPVPSADSEKLAYIRVKLASREDFERAGIPRPHMLRDLRFQARINEQGRTAIGVTSARAIREPFLNFLLEVATPNGRLVREYTLLLDPVHYHGRQPPPSLDRSSSELTSPASQSAPTLAATPAPVKAPPPADRVHGPVKAGESISRLGFKLRPDPGVAGAQMSWALFLANPDAFIEGDIHNLRVGAMLRVPTREAALATPYFEALQLVRSGPRAPQSTKPVDVAVMAPPVTEPKAAEPQPVEEAAAGQPPVEKFQLKLLTADEEQALPNPTVSVREPVLDFDQADLPQAVRQAGTRAQDLALENQRLSARLAAAEQILSTLQAEAQAREQQLEQLRRKLAKAEAGKLPAQASAAGITMAGPAPAVEPGADPGEKPPERADDSMSLLSVAGQGLALIAIVGLLVWLMVRRQQRAGRGMEDFAEARFGAPDGLPGLTQANAPWAAPGSNKDGDRHKGGSPSGTNTGQEPDPVAHSISEAELCLAYGQYGVAEGILQRLVDSEPEAAEHRLRLLHVLHAAKRREPFLEHAHALRALVQDSTSRTWCEAAELGRELFPEEALFQIPPAPEKESDFEATMLTGVQTDYALPETPAEQERPTRHTGIDTEHLDFPVVAESAKAAADPADANTPSELDLDIGSTETDARTPEQADMDLTDELLAWDPAESDPEPIAPDEDSPSTTPPASPESAAASRSEGGAQAPGPSTDRAEGRGMWDELRFSTADEGGGRQDMAENALVSDGGLSAPESDGTGGRASTEEDAPSEQESARSAAAGKD